MRLFVALRLPDAVAGAIQQIQSGVPGARWQTHEQLHLTLRFIGEADGRMAAMLDDALSAVAAPGFRLQLHGVGQFGRDHRPRQVRGGGTGAARYQPHSLWAGVRANAALAHLQRKVDNAIRRAGPPSDRRKFTPHVTLARLGPSDGGRILEWLMRHALFSAPECAVGAFHLYSSRPVTGGGAYVIERTYPLEGDNGEAGG